MNDLLSFILSIVGPLTCFGLGVLSGRNQDRDDILRARAKGFYEGQDSRNWEVKLFKERIRHLEAQARTISSSEVPTNLLTRAQAESYKARLLELQAKKLPNPHPKHENQT